MQSQADSLEFREWAPALSVALSPSQVRTLRASFKATVQPSDAGPGLFDVRPGNLIGTVHVNGTSLIVRPKIDINRVLFMIAYSQDPFHWESDWSALNDVPSLIDGLAELFVRSCERVLNRGLLRGYRPAADDLRLVRGRIDFSRQLKRRPGQTIPVALRFSVYDEDIVENQLLAAAARIVTAMPLTSAPLRSRLRRVLRDLGSVQRLGMAASLPTIRWTRTNEYMRPAVELAELILRGRMLDVAIGTASVPGFVVPLYAVFEDFVRRALREAAELSEAAFPPPGTPLHLAEHNAIAMKPDLQWVVGGARHFVGDVKYKRDSGSGKDSDLYQVLAYAIAADLPTASLIYAEGPADVPAHQVRHIGRRLHLHHIELHKEPRDVLAQLAQVAASHRLGCFAPNSPLHACSPATR